MIFQNGHPMIMMIKKLYAVEKIHLLSKWYCILFSQKSSIFYALVCFCVTFCWFLNMYLACYFTSIPITGLQHVSLWLMSSFDPPFSHSTGSRDHVIHIFIENNVGTGITMCLYAHDSVFVKCIEINAKITSKCMSSWSWKYIITLFRTFLSLAVFTFWWCHHNWLHNALWDLRIVPWVIFTARSWKNTSHSNLMETYLCPCSYCNEIIATDFYLCLCSGTGTSKSSINILAKLVLT